MSPFSPKRRTLAKLYHERWRIETSYLEFKQTFHADVLRSKTVANVEKEFAAHVLAYQLVRGLIVAAAARHGRKPTEISLLDAARLVVRFSHHMAAAPAAALPIYTRAPAGCHRRQPGRRPPRPPRTPRPNTRMETLPAPPQNPIRLAKPTPPEGYLMLISPPLYCVPRTRRRCGP